MCYCVFICHILHFCYYLENGKIAIRHDFDGDNDCYCQCISYKYNVMHEYEERNAYTKTDHIHRGTGTHKIILHNTNISLWMIFIPLRPSDNKSLSSTEHYFILSTYMVAHRNIFYMQSQFVIKQLIGNIYLNALFVIQWQFVKSVATHYIV